MSLRSPTVFAGDCPKRCIVEMDWKRLRTCVAPNGEFAFGVHRPRYRVANLREHDFVCSLGKTPDGRTVENQVNFPAEDVTEPAADAVIEVPNPLPFRGATFILQRSADRIAKDPSAIALPDAPPLSFFRTLADALTGPDSEKLADRIFERLPPPLRLALAVSSTDADDLVRLARQCCAFIEDPRTGLPSGLRFSAGKNGTRRPEITDAALFEALANNPHLPDVYKEVMVLRPGVQGGSEIVGEFRGAGGSHVFEYLRRNSYIPWGHYAANMAHDAVRYRIQDLGLADVAGMRHLYYQRTYLRLAETMGLAAKERRKSMTPEALESIRRKILEEKAAGAVPEPPFNATLWGWNFGFDYAPNRYRLHASHQQIHQQYALIPGRMEVSAGPAHPPVYAFGDMVADFCRLYREATGRPFFDAYLAAIRSNRRTDGHPTRPRSLVVHEDAHCLVFVPKAQTAQWELQVMMVMPVGNILEAGIDTRRSLDRAIFLAARVLGAMGARMITIFEFSKRFDAADRDQRIVYSFLPRLPESPGAFSEAQYRWINGHYPEDFAEACRRRLGPILEEIEEERC